jgi:hypothetical protein
MLNVRVARDNKSDKFRSIVPSSKSAKKDEEENKLRKGMR